MYYYYNEDTEESTWERPVGGPPPPMPPPPPSPPPPPTSEETTDSEETDSEELPAGWKAYWDDEYKLYYYFNENTGEATWEKPLYSPSPMGPPPLPAEPVEPTEEQGEKEFAAEQVQKEPVVPIEAPAEDAAGEQESPSAEPVDTSLALPLPVTTNPPPPPPPPPPPVSPPARPPFTVTVTVTQDDMVSWQAFWDTQYGTYYYYHPASGTTTWEAPPGRTDPPPRPMGPPPASSSPPPSTASSSAGSELLPVGWYSFWDEDFGAYYYYNLVTGEATWIKPAYHAPSRPMGSPPSSSVLPPATPPSSSPTLPPASSPPSSPTPPGGGEGGSGTAPVDTDSGETTTNSELLPEGWEAVWSGEYGEYYYFNEATGQATWEKPPYRPPPMLPAPVPEDDAHLPEGWVSAFDEEYEMYYYYNAATGVSTWDKPGAVVMEVVQGPVLPKSLDCGLTCVGTCPGVCGDGMRVGAEGCDDGNTVSGDGCSATCTLEANFQCVEVPWQAVWDDEYSLYYYWNSATGESVWTKPARQTFGDTGIPKPN
jgi:cysteine-rich repeat protein